MTTETSIYEYAKQGLKVSENKTALWFYGRSVSYKLLFEKIDCVADNLYRLGVRQGTVVTIHLPNCPQAVIAIYAIAKLGGICNIVHPQVPRITLEENMEFCDSRILITGDHFKEGALLSPDLLCVCVKLADYMGLVYKSAYSVKNKCKNNTTICFSELERPAKERAPAVDPGSLANCCVAYLNSSGTTGTPKTVMHSHQSLNNWVSNAQVFFRGEGLREEVVLSALPFFHGSGLVLNLHQVLCGGGAQVLLATWNAKQATRFIRKYRVSIITGVPYLFKSLLEQPKFARKGTAHLTQCFVSGDRVSSELKKNFDSAVGHRTLFEGYGMTEIVTACFSTSKYDDRIDASGYPLINCFVAVLTDEGLISTSGRGELIVSTNTMMLGYLNEDSSSCFLHHDGKIWLKTGDHGEIDEDGYLYFRERIKNVIVRKGYNIYPNEIENVIRRFSFASDVCVLGTTGPNMKGEEVIVFVEASDGCEATMQAFIQKECCERLPRYAHPSKIIVLRAFPRNKMKKVDRQALRRLI